MRRADRLMQIIQILRRESRPVTAAAVAEELEVTPRTIYRDMVSLQANNVPVIGEAGVGYVLGQGFDLPPLMFSANELEALMLGARMVEARGDAELIRAARDAIAKIGTVVPQDLRPLLLEAPLYASDSAVQEVDKVDVAPLREAIRQCVKVSLKYTDEKGSDTERVIWPLAIGYMVTVRMVIAWCELRQDFRNFRTDRISQLIVSGERYPARRNVLLADWKALEEAQKADRCQSISEV
ncbi:MAG: YafY family protein [Pseudomonadota bacterium]